MQDRYDPSSSIGWLHHLHHVWPQEAAFHSTYLWIEYLLLEIHALNESHEKATTTQERVELQEQCYVVMDEFELQLESIETDEQRRFVMENLPFNRSD